MAHSAHRRPLSLPDPGCTSCAGGHLSRWPGCVPSSRHLQHRLPTMAPQSLPRFSEPSPAPAVLPRGRVHLLAPTFLVCPLGMPCPVPQALCFRSTPLKLFLCLTRKPRAFRNITLCSQHRPFSRNHPAEAESWEFHEMNLSSPC